MKTIYFIAACIISVAACSKKDNTTDHPESHSSTLHFKVSNNSNITYFNVYNNDDLIMQLNSTSVDGASKYRVQLDDISTHPYNLNYAVEPLFMDSTNADVNMHLKIEVDDELATEKEVSNILFGETAQLAYSGQ